MRQSRGIGFRRQGPIRLGKPDAGGGAQRERLPWEGRKVRIQDFSAVPEIGKGVADYEESRRIRRACAATSSK
jgi:hypothetical protein